MIVNSDYVGCFALSRRVRLLQFFFYSQFPIFWARIAEFYLISHKLKKKRVGKNHV